MNRIHADVVVWQATPGGIMAAIAAARGGHSVVLLERSGHVGGLPANGLGATDVGRRGTTGGLFTEFRQRIMEYYGEKSGHDPQVMKDADDGHHFEPHVAEQVFTQMLAEYDGLIRIFKRHQFDFGVGDILVENGRVLSMRVVDRETKEKRWVDANLFIDASYEGDLAAAAGVPFRLGREGKDEFNEPVAGRIYRRWYEEWGNEHSGEGDDRIQAYNYRLCLTRDPDRRVPITRPLNYRREEYVSLIDDVRLNRWTGKISGELELDGIGRLVNLVKLPYGKTDANNQHLAFISTDLPEENQAWPTASWEWRDQFAQRLRDYTLGLLWFAQNDLELPEEFRRRCAEWGLASDEYQDNGHFPRQVYVREGRRMMGRYLFKAQDTLSADKVDGRPPIHLDSVTASHYPLDSHATRKREVGRPHLEGFFSYRNRPYTVPFRVMVADGFDNLLFPVPVSGTHVGFSTLRMEPCWMALGQAAGVAADLALRHGRSVHDLPMDVLQRRLLKQGAVLLFFEDMSPGESGWIGLQLSAMKGASFSESWKAWPDEAADRLFTEEMARLWGCSTQDFPSGKTRRDIWMELENRQAEC